MGMGAYFTHIDLITPASSTTGFTPLGAASETLPTAAAAQRVTNRSAPGTLKNFYANVTINANPNSTTFAVRINGSVANLSISIPASTTGVLSDLVGSDAVADGDTFGHSLTTGASATDLRVICGVQYDTSGNFVFEPAGGSSAGTAVSTASTAYYSTTMGRSAFSTTESSNRISALGSTTISKLQFYVSANARSTDTVAVSRNNGADGNQTATVTASTTGLFEDTSNSDTVSDTNYYSSKFTTGTGTGNLTFRFSSYRVAPSGTNACPVYAGTGFSLSAANSTQRSFVNNLKTGGAPMPCGGQATQLYIDISANTVSATSTITLRKNASNTALAASITASTTGRFADTTNAVSFLPADLFDVDLTAGSTGTTLTIREYGMLITPASNLNLKASGVIGGNSSQDQFSASLAQMGWGI